MAIRPEIALQTRVPDLGAAFNNALLAVKGIDEGRTRREQAPIENRLLAAQADAAEGAVTEQDQNNRVRSLAIFGNDLQGDLQAGNLESVRNRTVRRIAQLSEQGIQSNDSQELLTSVLDNPNLSDEQKIAQTGQLAQRVNQRAIQLGVMEAPTATDRSKFIGTPQRISRNVTDEATGETTSKNFLSGVVQNQDGSFTRQDVPVDGNFLSTLGETAEQQSTRVVQEAGDVAGAKVVGETTATAKVAPTIAKTRSFINTQVKLAEKAATERGEVLTDLSRAKAALPGLTNVVDQLRSLAPIATSTFGGKVWDTAVKELGFGSTKGATASAKFGAMVNNQVLPLLKPTFGAAFTVPEGDALRATMGDKDASVEEKMATLDAFMDQKRRDIETKELQLNEGTEGVAPVVANQAQFDALPSGATYTQSNGEVFTKP